MSSLVRSTGIVAFSTLLSRIFGFVREMLFAKFFGASASTDAFFVAFRIPNLFRRMVAEGALTISFIPVYSDYLVNSGEEEARRLAQKTLTLLVLVLSLIIGAGIIFAPQIVKLFAWGFNDVSQMELAVELTRLMFPFLFMVSLVAFSMGILNSHNYFFAPAFAPVLFNISFITGILIFTKFFEEPLFGVAAGVLVGGFVQIILQIPYLAKSGFKMRISFDLRHPGIRKIFTLMAPAVFGAAVYQINILMSTLLASLLPEGSISYLYYSDRLTEMVLGIFIVSIGNVILPRMSRMSAKNDISNLRTLFGDAISASLFLAFPAAAALMVIGLPVISVLFVRGEFNFTHAEMTGRALYYASMGIVPVAILRITTPTFYSMKDTLSPVLTAILAFTLNISLGYVLMNTALLHAGLALANSIAVCVQIMILLVILNRRIGSLNLKIILPNIFKCFVSSLVMVFVLHKMNGMVNWQNGPLFDRIVMLVLMVIAGSFTYFLTCGILRVRELFYLKSRLYERLGLRY